MIKIYKTEQFETEKEVNDFTKTKEDAVIKKGYQLPFAVTYLRK